MHIPTVALTVPQIACGRLFALTFQSVEEPMAPARPQITGRDAAEKDPLAVTVRRACELSGLGPTSIWAFLKDGRLEAVRVPGVRRTLVSYASLARLLSPASDSQPMARGRGRPCKSGTAPVTP
jgi:hypothetical protein